jgi:hypothetical protein
VKSEIQNLMLGPGPRSTHLAFRLSLSKGRIGQANFVNSSAGHYDLHFLRRSYGKRSSAEACAKHLKDAIENQ